MHPYFGAYSAIFVGWALAAILGGGSAVWLMYRAGLSHFQIAIAFYARAAALLLGAKLLYLIETWPGWTVDGSTMMAALFSEQMRIPGGIALVLALAPLLARATGVGFLTVADTIAPSGGLLMFGGRIGCFLQGCCHGTPTGLPWAVRFPAGTQPYAWQVQHDLIPPGAPFSTPVHPLQLYFALVGVLVFVALAAYQPRKRYDGEVLLLFLLSYLWTTWLLEFLRARPHELTQQFVLAGAVTATVIAVAAEWRLRAHSNSLVT